MLEGQFQAKLNHAWASIPQPRIARGHIRRRADSAERFAIELHVGQSEIGMVENVEKLRAEPQRPVLGDARTTSLPGPWFI